ncbi:hypothetical protein HNR25_005164 [Streptomonospora salina]|uniref:DUF4145 domain-containing protein n=1 Tax=Streptomonospora salina TaxID=104205 RepID=A0A841EJY2_9ACTN|nr:DUF4145 domain-containing protein [Streptomonospora salina]MBB6001333.1 hypothetical protein [Streptomonospora salina]
MTTPRPSGDLPGHDDHAGLCPNPACGKYVQFNLCNPVSRSSGHQQRGDLQLWPTYNEAAPTSGFHTPDGILLTVWQCPVCKETAVVFEHRTAGRSHRLLAWPRRTPREVDPAVPEEIRSLFAEGSEAEHAGALRAAAAMYRATVEKLCADRGATKGGLKAQINALKEQGTVEDSVVDDLHEARLLGNWSLHDALEFSAHEVADVADLIHEALFEVYVQPAQRAAMREARRNRRDNHRAGETEPT